MNNEYSLDLAGQQTAELADFGRRNPLEIGASLRTLASRADFVMADFGCGQLVTRVLQVDDATRIFIFDSGHVPKENQAILAADHLQFHASPEGVRVTFATGKPKEIIFDGRPAFEAAFPSVLFRMQRREYFRVKTPVMDAYICRGRLPNGERFNCELDDLSLGGVALRTMDERVAELEIGMVLQNVELLFGHRGKVVVDLRLVSSRRGETLNGSRRITFGFKFASLRGTAENTLQRLITLLEVRRQTFMR